MSAKSACKSCGINVTGHVDQHIIDREKSVSDEVYEERLNLCMECPALMYGTTCQYSGELVAYRTLFNEKSCPRPGQPRW